MKTHLQGQLGGNTLQGWNKVLKKAVYALNQSPICVAISAIDRSHGFKNQGVEMGVVPFTITPGDPLAEHLLPIPTTFYSVT